MKIIVQRVLEAKVEIEEEITGQIERGYLLYVCLEENDTNETIQTAVDKISKLRINEDENAKMNLNISQIDGSILSISQFTLSWDGKKGHRPSFEKSMKPAQAKLMYHLFNKEFEKRGIKVETGRFGADMKVSSINDGPVTFHLNF